MKTIKYRENPFPHTCKGERYLTGCLSCKWNNLFITQKLSVPDIEMLMAEEIKQLKKENNVQ